jgi:mRNA interferase RelE/StbE
MNWNVEFIKEAQRDMKRLDHSAQIQVLKGIRKVAQNHVSAHEGGYGKPLGHHNGADLTGLSKIKFRNLGLHIIYKIEMVDSRMKIIVVSARSDDQVYREAARRRTKYDL